MPKKPATPAILRVLTGISPTTGVKHRLTFLENGLLRIERGRYVSENADGWTQEFAVLTEPVELHRHLIYTIELNQTEL